MQNLSFFLPELYLTLLAHSVVHLQILHKNEFQPTMFSLPNDTNFNSFYCKICASLVGRGILPLTVSRGVHTMYSTAIWQIVRKEQQVKQHWPSVTENERIALWALQWQSI